MRPDVIAGELAGEITGFAIVGAVGGRREEEAGFRPRPDKEGAKEMELLVNII